MISKTNVQPLRHSLRQLLNNNNLIGAEIGVGGGVNAESILRWLDIQKLYLIDPYEKYQGNILGCHVRVTKATHKFEEARNRLDPSKIAWILDISWHAHSHIKDEELDFLYLDGNHFYEYVKKDLELYYPKIKIGGVFCGHDYNESGRYTDRGCNVKKAVDEFVEENNLKLNVCKDGVDWYIKKEL